MLSRLLSTALMLLCGAGLLIAWIPDQVHWYIFDALIFGLLILWTSVWSVGKVEATGSWLLAPLLGVVACGAVQLVLHWSVYAFATAVDVIRWGTYFSVLFLAAQLFDGEMGRQFRRAFVIYALVVAIVSVLQYFLGNGRIYWLFDTRETAGLGPFLNRDHFATFIALALPMALVEMVRHSRRRWFYAVSTAILYASVVAGASRAGFVLVTLELVLLSVLLGLSGRMVLAVVGLIVIFGFVVGWGHLYERLQVPDPYSGRREVVASTVTMIRSNPWRGYGLGTWTYVYPAYAQKDFGVFINAAHNDWLQWAADGGLPMAGCLLLLAGGTCVSVRRAPWALGVPIAFLHCAIDFPMQGRYLPALVFLVLGAAIRSAKHR